MRSRSSIASTAEGSGVRIRKIGAPPAQATKP